MPQRLTFSNETVRAGFERGDGVDDGGLVRAGIGQRAHQHVAADSGEGVQITEQGHIFIMDDCDALRCLYAEPV